MYYFKHSLLMFMVVFAAGCSSSEDSAPTLIPLDTSIIRAYQPGDTMMASLTMTRIADGQKVTGDVTITVGDIVQNPYGIDCRVVDYSGTLTGTAGSEVIAARLLSYQDGNNSMYDCGGYNDTLGRYVFLIDNATSPDGIFLDEKSPVQIGDTTSGVITFDDGTWEDCTRSVQAIENVSTPLGFYESYRVHETCSFSDGTVSDDTLWTVPSITELKLLGTLDGFSTEMLLTDYSFK
ncbi:MAG: hypothetical protein WBO93_10675 [Gammaproteobacteria bacterium]